MNAAAAGHLLLLPGLGLGEEAWRPTVMAYDAPATVIGFSGYGVSAPRDHDLSPPALAAEIVSQRLGPEPVVLAGHSASCQVAAHVAALAPEIVVALVLVGPTTDSAAATWPRIAGQWLCTAAMEPKGQVPVLVRQWSRTGLGTMLRAMEAARHDRIDEVLRQLDMPVLVIRGRHDAICRPAWAMDLARQGRGPQTAAVTLPAGAHMVPYTHGDLVAAAVRRFLGSVSRP